MSVRDHIIQDELELEGLRWKSVRRFHQRWGRWQRSGPRWRPHFGASYPLHSGTKVPAWFVKGKKSFEKEGCNAGGGQGRSLSQEEGASGEGCDGPQGTVKNPSVVPRWSHFRAFWHDKDMEESCRKVLLAGVVKASETTGRPQNLTSRVYAMLIYNYTLSFRWNTAMCTREWTRR